jgi:protein SCO1/2
MNARKLLLALAALAVAGAVELHADELEHEPAGGESDGRAVIGGPFSLVDHTGRRVSESDFRGKLMLVYFGYTYCPDVCPTELTAMSRALDLLGDEASEVTPFFITIDRSRSV